MHSQRSPARPATVPASGRHVRGTWLQTHLSEHLLCSQQPRGKHIPSGFSPSGTRLATRPGSGLHVPATPVQLRRLRSLPRTQNLSAFLRLLLPPKGALPSPKRGDTGRDSTPMRLSLAGAGGLRPLGPSLRRWGSSCGEGEGGLALASLSRVQPSGEPRLHPAQGTSW